MKHSIIDLNGQPIEISDLDRAIAKADEYRRYHHLNPGFKDLDERLEAYWTDVYNKLITIREGQGK